MFNCAKLKDSLPIILCLLVHIFDFSLQSGVFPSLWKRALVRPLPKTKSASLLSEFRPISILYAVSKILESLAAKQISSFITKKRILYTHQSGFRKGHSTHTALIRMVDDFRDAVNSKSITLVVSIDFSRAFDVMNIAVLIDKLLSLGFSNSACNWVKSFSWGRSQSVKLPNGELFSPLTRCSGVPQGSGLGPLFFSLFINDLPSVVEFCKFHLYADDFVIYLSGPFKNAQTIISKVNCDLDNISRWAADNGLSINTQKTQAMWVGSRGYINMMDSLNLLSVLLNGTTVAFKSPSKY